MQQYFALALCLFGLGSGAETAASSAHTRLIGAKESRLEVSLDGGVTWGTVCDRGFDWNGVEVACKSLGFGSGSRVANRGLGNDLDSPVLINHVACQGTESSLLECSFDLHSTSACTHEQDVYVECTAEPRYQVELWGGNPGRLQFSRYFGNTFGLVCDDNFTPEDARVACRSMGYADGTVYRNLDLDIVGGREIVSELDDPECTGSEAHLAECSTVDCYSKGFMYSTDCNTYSEEKQDAGRLLEGDYTDYGMLSDCDPGSEVYLGCEGSLPTPAPTPVPDMMAFTRRTRLALGNPGRLEVSRNGVVYGTVCDEGFTDEDAAVACMSMGFTSGSVAANPGYPVASGAVLMANVQCAGYEDALWNCPHDTEHTCTHASDVFVSCTGPVDVTTRLTGGNPGRLEISRVNGASWGVVCGDFFDAREELVACRGMGFRGGRRVANPGIRGLDPTLAFALDNAECLGTEPHIVACAGRFPTHNCSGSEPVFLQCDMTVAPTPKPTPLPPVQAATTHTRLMFGPRGRLEVSPDGGETWGTVCDDRFGNVDAGVACRSLGFSGGRRSSNPGYPLASGAILMDEVGCKGSEATIWDCPHKTQHDCSKVEDTYIECVPVTPRPSQAPTTSRPTRAPTQYPTQRPSREPTLFPTRAPTTPRPSKMPTTSRPSRSPTPRPSSRLRQ